jgi:hypothetical protein
MQGLSNAAEADSESVEELAEEGQAFELKPSTPWRMRQMRIWRKLQRGKSWRMMFPRNT